MTFPQILEKGSNWVLAGILVGIPLYGWFKGVKVYEAFIEGAKEGFNVAVRIIPFLVAILAAVGAFRGSGAMYPYSSAPTGRQSRKVIWPSLPRLSTPADPLSCWLPYTRYGNALSVMTW